MKHVATKNGNPHLRHTLNIMSETYRQLVLTQNRDENRVKYSSK